MASPPFPLLFWSYASLCGSSSTAFCGFFGSLHPYSVPPQSAPIPPLLPAVVIIHYETTIGECEVSDE